MWAKENEIDIRAILKAHLKLAVMNLKWNQSSSLYDYLQPWSMVCVYEVESSQTVGFKQGWALGKHDKAEEGQSAFKGIIKLWNLS